MRKKKIAIIVNPSKEKETPFISIFNKVFEKYDIDWDIFVTHKSGDAKKATLQCVDQQYNSIVACGGDGTVHEVSSAMVGTNIPLGIIPAGTANVLANELLIPWDIELACEKIAKSNKIRIIDTVTVNDEFFLLRFGIGLEADMVQGASRDLKNILGGFAYLLSAMRSFLFSRNLNTYSINIDGNQNIEKGITCLVNNTGNVGIHGLTLSSKIKIDDGFIDVIVIRNPFELQNLLKSIGNIRDWQKQTAILKCYSGKNITIGVTDTNNMQIDGEKFEYTDTLRFKIQEKSLHVIV